MSGFADLLGRESEVCGDTPTADILVVGSLVVELVDLEDLHRYSGEGVCGLNGGPRAKSLVVETVADLIAAEVLKEVGSITSDGPVFGILELDQQVRAGTGDLVKDILGEVQGVQEPELRESAAQSGFCFLDSRYSGGQFLALITQRPDESWEVDLADQAESREPVTAHVGSIEDAESAGGSAWGQSTRQQFLALEL